MFISPHKFVGGPGTPGIVIAKKWMFRNQVPDRVGGGTVVYVSNINPYVTNEHSHPYHVHESIFILGASGVILYF